MNQNDKYKLINWCLRFLKGMVIGAGTILPGVSGGALTAVFGLYEPIVNFLSDIKKDFWNNFLFFIPIGLGGLFGVFSLAAPIEYGLKFYPVHILWGFIGAIIGTLPSLYSEAGKKGRTFKHLIITILTVILSFYILFYIKKNLDIEFPKNIMTWIFSGSVFGSGLIIPGLSTSNFLIYLNLYLDLIHSIKTFDFSVLLPLGISAVLTVILFAKLMKKIINKAYAIVFHIIFGIVISSTIMIAPETVLYASLRFTDYVIIVFIFFLGIFITYFISQLEQQLNKKGSAYK